MKIKDFNYLVLIVFVLFGCESKKSDVKSESQPNYYKTLKKSSKKIRLAIDEETSNISLHFSYYDPDSIWFFNLNQINNEIQMFDLNTNTLEVPVGLTSAFVLSSYFYSPPTLINDKLIVKSNVQADYRKITDKQLSLNSLAYSIDLQTGKVNVLPHFYPKGYLPNGPRHFEHSFAVTDSKIVYSFFADHNLYYADLEGSKLMKKNAPSRYFKGEFEDFPLEGNRMDTYKYLSSSPHYESLMFDKYRKVFYRFCYPKVELDDESEIMKAKIYPNLFSILILDSELNIIGETKFEDEKFLTNNAFVAREGIYISTNHTDNPKNEEDYLQFQLFELNDVTDAE